MRLVGSARFTFFPDHWQLTTGNCFKQGKEPCKDGLSGE